MKIFGLEIRKYVSKKEQINKCRIAYNMNKNEVFNEVIDNRDIPWVVCGRTGRWLLIASNSDYAKGCIKKPNIANIDEMCDYRAYSCYRFINPDKLNTKYEHLPQRDL